MRFAVNMLVLASLVVGVLVTASVTASASASVRLAVANYWVSRGAQQK